MYENQRIANLEEVEFEAKCEAYEEAFTRMFQYVINELEQRDDILWHTNLQIAEELIDMEWNDVTEQAVANGVEDAIAKMYQFADKVNVVSVRV